MKKKKLIIIGAGGHSKSCLEVVESSKEYKVVGFIDNRKITNSFYKKFKIYKEGDLEKIFKIVKNVHIGIAHIKSPSLRIKLFKRYKTKGFRFPVLTHSKAYVSKFTSIKEGTLIVVDDNLYMKNADTNKKFGKGRMIQELMKSIGIPPYIDGYHMGWIWEDTI